MLFSGGSGWPRSRIAFSVSVTQLTTLGKYCLTISEVITRRVSCWQPLESSYPGLRADRILTLGHPEADQPSLVLLDLVQVAIRNNGLSPITGTILLHSNRYIFLWIRSDNSLVVVPQAEVQMIQAPSSLLSGAASVSPAPIAHSPTKAETSSPVQN